MQRTVLLFVTFVIEAIILWQYTSRLFTPPYSPKVELVWLSILYTLLFLISLLGITGLNTFSYFLINALFLSSQYHVQWLLAVFHSAILTAIMGGSELAALGIVSQFAPHFVTEAGIALTLYMTFSKILFFTIVYLLLHIICSRNNKQRLSDRTDIFLIPIPFASVFIMLTFFAVGESSPLFPPANIMVMISAIFLLLMNLLIFGINQYNQNKNAEFTEMQLLLQKESDTAEYYEMLLSQTENQSILIHDIKKHLQSIQLLNAEKKPEKVESYILRLLDSSDLKESVRICDNEMLSAILSRYQRQCREKQIAFHTDIRSGTVRNLDPHDITSLFCNLLDNAVEATQSLPDAFIEITVQKKENSPFIIVVLLNTCKDRPKFDRNGLPVSSKPNNGRHGFGIKSIQKTIAQYDGSLQMYYDDSTQIYHTVIALKDK